MQLPQSSQGNGKESLTFVGLVIMAIPLITSVLSSQGINIAQSDLVDLAENITAAIGIIISIVGGVRKIYNAIKK